jgi:ABC-2 type transport system ATP-binding protein
MRTNAISALGLVKNYRSGFGDESVRAVDSVDLNVRENEIFGIFGPNGSGKTTTLKMILGLVKPTAGECRVFDHPSGAPAARARIGFLPESVNFGGLWTGREWLSFFGGVSSLSGYALSDAVARVLALSGLEAAADRRVSEYSRGMAQRLALARAIIHDPDLVVLDEPAAGLDPIAVAELTEILLDLKRTGKTVVVCSHLLSHAEEICDRFALFYQGRIIFSGSQEDLEADSGLRRFRVTGYSDALDEPLREFLAARGASLVGRLQPCASLDEVFIEMCGKETPREGEVSGGEPTVE